MNIESIQPISDIIDGTSVKSSDLYNIFRVLDIENNEVLLCRFLRSLLVPNGEHMMGVLPLQLFIKNVLGVNERDDDLCNSRIVLEEIIDCPSNERQFGRVDIVIHIQNRVYPIEVKVWGADQPKQLEDYYNHYFHETNNGIIYYLTPDGHEPTNESKGQLKSAHYKCISFKSHIQKWLENIVPECKEPIKSIVMQYQEVIAKMSENENALQDIKKHINFVNPDKEQLAFINSLAYLCQTKIASEIRKDIRDKYWYQRISLGNNYMYGDLESNIPDIDYKYQIVFYIISKHDKAFHSWLGIDNYGLYLLYQDADGEFAYDYIKDPNLKYINMDIYELGEIRIEENLDGIKR